MLDVILRVLPVIGSVLGSGLVVSTVKALIDSRANSSERHLAQREAEILAKLKPGSRAARNSSGFLRTAPTAGEANC
jgi:hypothetical protein